MYIPPAFRDDDIESIRATIRGARLASLVTATAEGPVATPLPLFLDESEGEHGVLYGHVAKANPQWKLPPIGDALAIFGGPDAYVTPSWYATKQETGKVVPTWNYVAVHAYGPVEFFWETEPLLDAVTAERMRSSLRNGQPFGDPRWSRTLEVRSWLIAVLQADSKAVAAGSPKNTNEIANSQGWS